VPRKTSLQNKLPFVEQDVKTLHTHSLYSHVILFPMRPLLHLGMTVYQMVLFPSGIFKWKCEDQDRQLIKNACIFVCGHT